MKADVDQQRSLLEVARLDAELARIDHRSKNLPEQQRLDEVQAEHRAAGDRLGALQIELADLDGQVAKMENEIDSVRKREDRDRALLTSGSVDAKQLTELQHEIETLERRQASLEDSLLEVMQRREDLQREQAQQQQRVDELQQDLDRAQQACADARADLDKQRDQAHARRAELTASLSKELLDLYERQRSRNGFGAGELLGGRCGACRIEIDRGELARIRAAADDEVTRCPECGAILLRVKGSRA